MAINLGNLGKKQAGKKTPERPIIKDEKLALKVDEFARLTEEKKSVEGALAVLNKEIRSAAFEEFLTYNSGGNAYTGSVEVIGTEFKVMASFTTGYRSLYDRDQIQPILGEEKTNEFFAEKFTLAIDGDQIPKAVQQTFVDRLVALCAELGIDPGDAIKADQRLVPNKDFNEKKVKLSKGIVRDLDAVVPTPSMLKASSIAPGSGVIIAAPATSSPDASPQDGSPAVAAAGESPTASPPIGRGRFTLDPALSFPCATVRSVVIEPCSLRTVASLLLKWPKN